MIEVFKILHGYYYNINNIYRGPHVDVAIQGVINIDGIKVLLNMILESTFHYNRVVSLWNSLSGDV